MMTELTPFLALIFCGTLLTTVVVPSTLAGVHLVCGSKRRATAIMLLLFFGNMIGMGLGPLVAGVISDYRSAVEGSESLRTALMIMTCVIPPGGWLFWRAAGSIAADTED
jgi:MFS family permease